MEEQLVYSERRITHEWTWRQIGSASGNMATTIPSPFRYNGLDVQIGATRYET